MDLQFGRQPILQATAAATIGPAPGPRYISRAVIAGGCKSGIHCHTFPQPAAKLAGRQPPATVAMTPILLSSPVGANTQFKCHLESPSPVPRV
ncbi:hypothetical protein ABLO00_05415 [Mycobacterium tuberculosis]